MYNKQENLRTDVWLIITIAGDNVIIFVKPNELVLISTQIYLKNIGFILTEK